MMRMQDICNPVPGEGCDGKKQGIPGDTQGAGAEAGGAEFVRVQAVGKAEFGKAHGAQPLFAPRFDARYEQHGGVERE